MNSLSPEAVMAALYALFLLGAALILEFSARSTHSRAKLYRHRGFRFHRHLDVWECPAGEHLARRDTDHTRKIVRYRARAEKCNTCALKAKCTDSDNGREVVHSTNEWLETEIGRFHRGISLAVIGISALILAIFWVRNHSLYDSLALGATLLIVSVPGIIFARSFWKEVFMNSAKSSGKSGLRSSSPWSNDSHGL